MKGWTEDVIGDLLDVAERALNECLTTMHLDGQIVRKERAVGIIPNASRTFSREQLEETVLVTQKILVSILRGHLTELPQDIYAPADCA